MISLNGVWILDYLGDTTYTECEEPEISSESVFASVPGYWEDMEELFHTTELHKKIKINPLYKVQRYPMAEYAPDMYLPNPIGSFVYRREFHLKDFPDAACELWFGGVQNTVSAWINGSFIGKHEGYSSSFALEIPSQVLVAGKNTITLAVSNTRLKGYKGRPIAGLTSRAANECSGGIYGDVEIRFYPDNLRDVWVSTAKDLKTFTIYTEGAKECAKKVLVNDMEYEIPTGENHLTLSTEGMKFWSPNEPNLYTVTVSTPNQVSEHRFGLRRLTADGAKLLFNNKPYFFRGVCEHCYHPITVHPTHDKAYYVKVLRTLKELGFNSLRFHTYIPMVEYMEAADELGMVIELETPNNTTYEEWKDIVRMARHFTSPLIYSSGNEMMIDWDYISHLRDCAAFVHENSDSLFSPMSAMRGVEYMLEETDGIVELPFPHCKKKLDALNEFCDVYNSFSWSQLSYASDRGDASFLETRNSIYGKPLLSHEICINGTYIDLSLQERYEGSRIGNTELLSSVEQHLTDKNLLDRANIYYQNSVKWQRLLRKYCFETLRRTPSFAGYDFLGDIDTHWHTFGYCVGMMNEFYELKGDETVENVKRYNNDTVLLADLPRCLNFTSGTEIQIPIWISYYGDEIGDGSLLLGIADKDKVYDSYYTSAIPLTTGTVQKLYTIGFKLPVTNQPLSLTLRAGFVGGKTIVDNEWDFYVFPQVTTSMVSRPIAVTRDIDLETLISKMKNGEHVLLLGTGPFAKADCSFQMSIAGRTAGPLATVINEHPIMKGFPHDGFCGWQFREMLNGSSAVVLDHPDAPFEPIIELACSYKNAYPEALLFEYQIGEGKLLVCTLDLKEDDPGATWLKAKMKDYVASEDFVPRHEITFDMLKELCSAKPTVENINDNVALNKNDITM